MKTINELKTLLNVRNLLWLIYLALLGVLLPHTAWAFRQFQSADGELLAWLLAFVFEASVFGFTHNLVERIERAYRLRRREAESWYAFDWRRFSEAYMNLNGLGLLSVSSVSALANFTYTVEFARPFNVYASYSIPPIVYYIAFGGILPLVSLLFAHVLAKPGPGEDAPNEAEEAMRARERVARKEANDLRLELNTLRLELEQVKDRAKVIERLFADDKRVRIVTARELFPDATGAAIASITGAGAGYVSEVLAGKIAVPVANGNGHPAGGER